MRFSTHPSSFGERPPPFNRFCTTSQPSSASPTKIPLLRTANNRVLLPTRAASRLGVCVHPCPFAAHGGSRAVSRIMYPVRAGPTRGYHHTERPRRVHGRTARRRGYRSRLDGYLRWSTAWKYAFRAGTWLGSLYNTSGGEGGGSALGCVVPFDPLV